MIKIDSITNRKSYIQYFFLLILCVGCTAHQTDEIPERIGKLKNLSAYTTNTNPATDINFNRDEVYGSAKEGLIGTIGSFAVDDSGRVFISDPQQNTIHVFRDNADYSTNIGREGKGPGEFYRVDDVQIKDQKLFAYDLTQFRYNVFSLDSLSFHHTVNLANNRENVEEISDATLRDTYVRDDNSFLAKFFKDSQQAKADWKKMETRGLYYLLDKDGNISSEKLLDVKDKTNVLVPYPGGATDGEGNSTSMRRMGHQPEFYGKSLMALTNNNHIFRAWSDTFLIKEYNPDGEYQRAIYYPYEKVPLSRESASAAEAPDFILKGWDSMDRPQTWPALNDLIIDDENRLWISTIVKNQNIYEWWVLKNNGELLTKFEWPRDKPIEEVKNGYMYTRESDERGVENIVKYEIEME